jgi:hypothetical protein
MTLNMTLITSAYVVQASDRRMVELPSGRIVNDKANKGLILQSEDGIFAVTFAGVGMYRGKRVDEWLAEKAAEEGVPEVPIERGVEMIRQVASDWFRTFPGGVDKRHTFVVAGWTGVGTSPEASIWVITNHGDERGRALETAAAEFAARCLPIRPRTAQFHAFGLIGSVERAERRRLDAVMRKNPDFDRAEAAVVDSIRSAATKPAWSWGINRDVLAVTLSPAGQARSTFYPQSAASYNYAPYVIWHSAGNNYIAGDADVLPSTGVDYLLGECLLIAPPGGDARHDLTPNDVEEIGFRFRMSDAKFKKEATGDATIIQLMPKSVR